MMCSGPDDRVGRFEHAQVKVEPGLSGLRAGTVKYGDPSLGAARERAAPMTSDELRNWEWGQQNPG